MIPRGVLLSGGTGFIGGHVIRALRARGIGVWVWSRDAARARGRLPADVHAVGALSEILADAPIDALVNLAGAQVLGWPWTRARRRVLIDSRVKTSEALIEWCARRAGTPGAVVPRTMISASAIGFYGPGGDDWFDETSPPQSNFQCELCVARERATEPARALGMRVVNLRIGLVLGANGGVLTPLALAARLCGAAVIGDGRQWMSWIHIDDMVRIVERALEDDRWDGPVNAVAPNPVQQRDFQRALTGVLHRPLWLRVPGALLELTLGDMAELLVEGQRVAPRRLLQAGFIYTHTVLEDALRDLLHANGGRT